MTSARETEVVGGDLSLPHGQELTEGEEEMSVCVEGISTGFDDISTCVDEVMNGEKYIYNIYKGVLASL